MMNNLENQNLFEEIVDENEKLREKVKALSLEVENLKEMYQGQISIETYCVKKYEEGFEKILQERVNKIHEDADSARKEINKLRLEKENIQELIQNNLTLTTSIESLNEVRDKNNIQVEEARIKLEKVVEKYKDSQSLLKKVTLGYYSTITKALIPPFDQTLIMGTVDFVVKQLDAELYKLILECRELNFEVEKNQHEFDEIVRKAETENENLEETVLELERKITHHTAQDLDDLLEIQEIKIKKYSGLEKELRSTFEMIKSQNIKAIIDKANYLKVCGKKNEDIVVIIEELIKTQFSVLESQQTFKQLRAAKEMELDALLDEENRIDVLKQKYDELTLTNDDSCKIYNEASLNIDKLVEFVDNVNLIIRENERFYLTINDYKAKKEEEENLAARLSITTTCCEELVQKRATQAISGAKEETLKELTEQIKIQNEEKNNLSTSLREIRDQIARIENAPDNLQLIAVYNEKEFTEAKLPKMYANLRELKVKLTKVKKEIASLEAALSGYRAMKERIRKLKYELNIE